MKIQILKDQMILVGGFHTHDVEYLLRTFLRRIKVETERRLMDRLVQAFEAVQLRLAAACLLRLDACLVAPDVLFGFFDMLLLLIVSLLVRFVLIRLCLQVARVASAEAADMVVLQIDDPRRRCIQEVAVMGNHEDPALVRAQVVFEPLEHAHIEVVRRFIEEQEVRMAHEGGSKIDADLLPTREGVDVSIPVFLREAEPGQDLLGHCFIVIAA